jgi:hypothetical protein
MVNHKLIKIVDTHTLPNGGDGARAKECLLVMLKFAAVGPGLAVPNNRSLTQAIPSPSHTSSTPHTCVTHAPFAPSSLLLYLCNSTSIVSMTFTVSIDTLISIGIDLGDLNQQNTRFWPIQASNQRKSHAMSSTRHNFHYLNHLIAQSLTSYLH